METVLLMILASMALMIKEVLIYPCWIPGQMELIRAWS